MDRNSTSEIPEAARAPTEDGRASGFDGVVRVALHDSWSTLEQEVALIDRLFGGDIAALFERCGDGGGRLVRR